MVDGGLVLTANVNGVATVFQQQTMVTVNSAAPQAINVSGYVNSNFTGGMITVVTQATADGGYKCTSMAHLTASFASYISTLNDGGCEVTLNSIAYDAGLVTSGTFSGNLAPYTGFDGGYVVVTNGQFSFVRK